MRLRLLRDRGQYSRQIKQGRNIQPAKRMTLHLMYQRVLIYRTLATSEFESQQQE